MSLPAAPGASFNLATAIANIVPTEASDGGGTAYLTFSGNTGDYTFGRDKELMNDEEVIVNIPVTCKGWTVWVNGSPEKQLVNYFTGDLPVQPAPIDGNAWTESRAIQIRTTDGEVEAVMEGNSYGMRKAVDNLLMAVKKRAADPQYSNTLFPIVELASENYENYKHGTGKLVYNPVFKIKGWADENGNVASELKAVEAKPAAAEEATTEPAEEAKPVRRRRKA